jgi:glycosyltransferase involved in cell wall biosynthesis
VTTPKISIIVPVFNVENYLVTLLESLLNQTEKSIEIIAVNDGSTDSSGKILHDIAEKDTRLLVINKQNGGVSSARNAGLEHAKGKWIAFADGDDWLHTSALETWLKQAEEHNLDFLLGNRFRFTSNPVTTELSPDNILLNQAPWDKIITGKDWIIKCMASDKWPHNVWLQFLNCEFVRNNNLQFKEDIVHEDILWTLNLALCAQRVGYCPSPFYGHRLTQDSIITSQSQKSILYRAASYIEVFHGLITAASINKQKVLHQALLRHLNFEVANFMVLMRKKTNSPEAKYKLAKKMLKPKMMLSMLQGVSNTRELWRVIRCWIFLYQIILPGAVQATLKHLHPYLQGAKHRDINS